jgi:hypothetical protein
LLKTEKLTPSAVALAPGGNRVPDRVEYVFRPAISFQETRD